MSGVSFDLKRDLLPLSVYEDCVRLACERQGTINPEAASWIAPIFRDLDDCGGGKQALAIRRTGTSLTAQELRALGIRKNSHIARTWYEALTKKGRNVPIDAADLVVLDVNHELSRRMNLRDVIEMGINNVQLLITRDDYSLSCKAAYALQQQVFSPTTTPSLPLSTCAAVVCGCTWMPWFAANDV